MKTIAWDVDDVLNDLMYLWFQSWSTDNSASAVRYADLTENPPHGILGITMESYLKSLDTFRLSSSYLDMAPIKEVREWFVDNGGRFRHIALTAVPLSAASVSAQWVLRHFGIWIRTFHFVPSKRQDLTLPVYDESKLSFMQWLDKVDIFIDDNPEQVRKAEMFGVKAYLFPRPWNNGGLRVNEILGEIGEL